MNALNPAVAEGKPQLEHSCARDTNESHPIRIPVEMASKWQDIVNLLAELVAVPTALIVRVEPPNHMSILISSESEGNPYEPGQTAFLSGHSYCEHVMRTRQLLHVAYAPDNKHWSTNPDLEVGMVSYLGLPITWPDGEIFGTICVRDCKTNLYNDTYLKLLMQWQSVVQTDLRTITAQRTQLEERNAKIQRLIDIDIVGMFIWNEHDVIVESNSEFLRIVGYDADELITKRIRWIDLTPSEWLDLEVQEWIPELSRTGLLRPVEKEFYRKDGSRASVLFGAATLQGSGDEGIAFVLDLSERKGIDARAREHERRYREMQSGLANANRITTMGYLAAAISHEIKQPLAACATNAAAGLRWLSSPMPNLEQVRRVLERINREARRASEITDRVRQLVKNTPPDTAWLQVNAAIREAVLLSHDEAQKHGVTLILHLDAHLPPVHYDKVQLQQVVLNLLANAIEAVSHAVDGLREVCVITGNHNPTIVDVLVCDSGTGVAENAVERLFEPFYTTKECGMGMGLSICRTIAQAFGGTLSFRANSPRGAVFHLTIPVARESETFSAVPSDSVPSARQ
jgi:PAS domain S-box-containing protein